MRIVNTRINHIENPVGFHMNSLTFNWKVVDAEGKRVCWARVQVAADRDMSQIVYDSGLCPKVFNILYDWKKETSGFVPQPCMRYYWQVTVEDNVGCQAVSEISFFEMAKPEKEWEGKWIASMQKRNSCILYREFEICQSIQWARLYITGLGLYEVYLNGQKVGDEYLTPGFNDYESFLQFQTYEAEKMLRNGRNHLEIWLGNGWYRGRYLSFGEKSRERYGDTLCALAELYVKYGDGTITKICTDCDWKSKGGNIVNAELYDGEVLDDTLALTEECVKVLPEMGYERLEARRSIPIKVMHIKNPVALIHTARGESVLDFGQNMAGWVTFYNRLPQGHTCRYVAGEILQDNCFYHDNLRSAKTEFVYISDGQEKWVRPHFTYYGFRYLLIEGFGDYTDLNDFVAEVLYSQMEQTGFLQTGHEKVNQLISNVLWGQRSNFIDVPTDCPQRDERLGWTGDTQVFAGTGMFQMNAVVFYRKYMYDMYQEQKKRNGKVPFVVPNISFEDQVSAAWSDAAVIVPWKLYMMYGDKEILKEQYAGMKAWLEYIRRRDRENGDQRIWYADCHFGDWLSLDAPNNEFTGGTDIVLIATAYYYQDAVLTAKAAEVLEYWQDVADYRQLAKEICQAFQREYFTESGRLAEDTQTAHALVLFMGLYREGQQLRLVERLEELIQQNGGCLNTGFVGTACLCSALSMHGKNRLAYQLLLNENYPSWLYQVNLGATTIWERWNSVLPDGRLNPDGMNSLNHYAYGAIVEWIYHYGAGIKPLEPGWRKIGIAPMPDRRLGKLQAEYQSESGKVVSGWEYLEDDRIHYYMEVPFNTTAELTLPDGTCMKVESGHYDYIQCAPKQGKGFDGFTEVTVLLSDDEAREVIGKHAPELLRIPVQYVQGNLKKIMLSVFSGGDRLKYDKLVAELKKL